MNPQTQFCHNPDGRATGQVGQGNMHVHSQTEQRYRCTSCGQTFAATTATPFYRLRTAADVVTLVLTLLSHGCPTQAIVAAFGVDERTVAAWVTRVGRHCQRVHQHVVQHGQVDLQHVQADELWGTRVGRRVRSAISRLAQIEKTVSSVGRATRNVRKDCRNLKPEPCSGSASRWCRPTGSEKMRACYALCAISATKRLGMRMTNARK
jgi:transposase-like protein